MEVYTSDSSDSDAREQKTLQYGRLNMAQDVIESDLMATLAENNDNKVETIFLNHNLLEKLPAHLLKFSHLKVLDVSSNNLTELPDQLFLLPLVTLVAKNNQLVNKSLPKSFGSTFETGTFAQSALKELNLSGNQLTHFPEQTLELKTLKYLYLGGNKISSIPKDIWKMSGLQLLSLGGNFITEVPESVGRLHNLQGLFLCDNRIESLPSSISLLTNLKSLLLHKNLLRHLPRGIITLKNLIELSLRDNPLVVRFVQDMALNPPTLMELAARVIKSVKIQFDSGDLPNSVSDYLSSANCCVNPKCKGVFFDNRVEHIKFVDFCGKYRVPLLEYLCSAKCITSAGSEHRHRENDANGYMMKKVLLG